MSFQIKGKLVKKYEIENKTNSFQTREFVIVTEEQYPQYIKFQLVQDRCTAIDRFNENDLITVYFDLRGREWQGKYFTNLNAWKVEAHENVDKIAGESIVADKEGRDPFDISKEELDDLPF